jgi:hypothetical protein
LRTQKRIGNSLAEAAEAAFPVNEVGKNVSTVRIVMSTNTPADVTLQHPQLSDDLLLSQAKSGDQQAFGELCLRYNGILKRKIFSIVRHYEDTEDVLQDTFLSAYKHLHAFRETCKFSTWLIQIGIEAQATWAL